MNIQRTNMLDASAQSIAAVTKRNDEGAFDAIETAVAAIARGEIVVVVDDENRENEGDLIVAAEMVTPEHIAFMVRYTSGVICLSLPGAVLDRLDIPLMVSNNTEIHTTAFTVSVDLREGISTGICAADRAATLRALSDPRSRPQNFARPGHVFPLRCHPGGVLARPGHTEAAGDLVALAGRKPGGVLCELVNDDGTMARRTDLFRFAMTHGLSIVSIAQLISYRQGEINVR